MGKKIKIILKQYRIIVNINSGPETRKISGKREVRANGESKCGMHAALRS
jgi:hypothetical protein